MKKIFVIAVCALLVACGTMKKWMPWNYWDQSIPSGDVAVVFNSNFTDPIGNLSTINLSDPTQVGMARVTTDGSDAVVRSFDNRIYVINRYGTDTIQVIDPNDFSVMANYSVGKGSNPQDIVVVSDALAFLSRLDAQNDTADQSDILIINPLTGERLGGIVLKPYTRDDGDRLARAGQMVRVEDWLYVCMQDLPTNMLEPANTNGKVAIIDINTNEVVDADPKRDGIQVIELSGRNPSDITYSPALDKFFIADTGVYINFVVDTSDANGGIEVVRREDHKSEGIVVKDEDLGGGVSEVRLNSETLGFTIIDSVAIASFNPTTYEIVSKEVYRSPGFFLPDFTIDSEGRLLIAEQDVNGPGIVILNATDGTKIAGPIGVGAPPSSITFVSE